MANQSGEGLELVGLRKILGGRVIIDDLNLVVNKGEMVSLLGPSGCGKTTTLRMIAGFLIPESGRVFLAGKDVTEIGPEKRPSAMVFQNYALWPHMTVFKNVAYPLKVRKMSKSEIEKRVHDVLGLVNLMHHKDSRPAQISGGEQQRVAVARALMNQPDIILADEPSGNLDSKNARELHQLFFSLRDKFNQTFIIVTHNDELAALADRKLVMADGKIAG
jgi:putative spermidine/putrescine transport system ATP-binding protein